MLPFLRLCATVLAAGAVIAAPAEAQAPAPSPVAPADGATAQAGAPLAFTARGQGALVVRVARSPAVVDACGALGEDGGRIAGTPSAADPTLMQFTAPAGLAAGEWFWQVGDPANCSVGPMRRLTVVGSGATAPATPPGAPAVGPAPSPANRLPTLARAPIPLRIGTSNHALLVLALGEGSPSVSRSRLVALVRNSARRWRLDARGPVKRVPRLGDGHDDVGFAGASSPRARWGPRRCCVRTTSACAACAPPRAVARRARRSARASSSATSPCSPTCPGQRGPRTRSATSTTSRP